MTKAFISGCAGTALTVSEIAFFREHDPWGLILFRRNCETPEQITKLVSAFRDAVSRPAAPVLIDQEGGRVQRLRPPHWSKYPPQKLYGDLYRADPERGREAAALGARLIACDLRKIGITVDCLPLLDVAFEGMVDAIGDRSISSDPKVVADLGEQVCAGLLSGGVLPVLKHLPGHGRAVVDSHLEMPRVDATLEELQAVDFVPFKALNRFPLAMTAHILFSDVDPLAPATQSAAVIETLIRGKIGFSGCLMSDDISMKALGGDMRERCAATFGAGCDLVLHCNGELAEMEAVADVAPKLSGLADVRCAKALAELKPVDPEFDETAARARLQVLIGEGYA
ncbi:beta-N-acetylhexosaminidase [Labrenzia sp. CE80]|uniref:beta-N-acetylhexosaminidase n=1 Tax=Labrenzia sp. CE80 TaxID=1788986 RepID=UPI00129B59DB|nr:beta-N-acetylhexosaminidase [Labrenzia sp. CE80]